MKAILILFTLLLTLAWSYTSWYWYTCNIKGFCDITSFSLTNDARVEEAKAKLMPERVAPVQEISQVTSSILGESSETNRAENVIVESEIEAESNAIVVPEITQTPTAESTCDTPLTGPIEFGKNNNIDEVKILEKFLISQGEDLEIDGTYKQEDFEAVKRFQLKYKSEILDPWGVTEPTGFVFRTTVKKINEIACR